MRLVVAAAVATGFLLAADPHASLEVDRTRVEVGYKLFHVGYHHRWGFYGALPTRDGSMRLVGNWMPVLRQ